MPYNLLIFPLIGGYFLITHVYFLKFDHQRIERQRLIFNSILAGIVLILISTVLVFLIKSSGTSFVIFFNSLTESFETKYLGTGLLSFLLGLVVPFLINPYLNEDEFIVKAIDKKGSQLEKLFLKSFLEDKKLAITLANGKIYIGSVSKIPRPGQAYITVLPFYSGYRDQSHGMVIDTQYLDVYENIDQFESLRKNDLETIISKAEIVSARTHIDEVYDFMN